MPSGITLIVFLIGAAVASYALTGAVRRHALRNAILDIPNDRSSHSTPTPRGGGLGLVVVIVAGLLLQLTTGFLAPRLAIALIGGGALIATAGWIDDRKSLSPFLRLAIQIVAAGWAVYWLGGMPVLHFGRTSFDVGLGGSVLAVLGIVWLTNLYNFMDGIDGIAGIEAVSVGTAAGALLLYRARPDLAAICFLVAAATLGFLAWNWPPARIFMGDVGSGFLGFVFGALAVSGEADNALPSIFWVLLLLVFVLDATLTLFRRGARRQRVHAAHREHAYQRAVQAGYSHGQVSLSILVINLSLAALVALGVWRDGNLWVYIGTAVILVLALYLLVETRRPMFSADGGTGRQH